MDCMEGMGKFPEKYFELAIVDPPYGVGDFTESKYSPFSGFKWNDKIPEKKYFTELMRVSKHQIIWGGNYYTEHLPPVKGWITWDKKNPVKNGHPRGELAWTSFNKPLDVAEIPWTAGWYRAKIETIIHPCQKPITLYRWCLKNYGEFGWKILDTHVGSGSSLIACEWEGFNYVGFELNKEYYEKTKLRVKQWLKNRQPELWGEIKK